MKNKECVLRMVNITKEFNGNAVLKDVNFDVLQGEVHGLIGANGAGKSTLMKILNGIYSTYKGKIILKGKEMSYSRPSDAQNSGICMIHQELDLVGNCTVAANIYLGRELYQNKSLGILDKKSMNEKVQELLDELQFDMKADAIVSKLSTAQQQLLLVAKCVSMNADIIVMDEPTSSLSDTEVKQLFKIIRNLRSMGKSIIYISHYLDEIFEVCDRVTILRDGSKIDTLNIPECDESKLVQFMVGQEFDSHHKYFRQKRYGEVIVSIKDFYDEAGYVNGISFDLHKGEIIGLAGVVGAGRTEFVELLYGVRKIKKGSMLLKGKEMRILKPGTAVKNGFAFISENRKTEGLINRRTIADNIAAVHYKECLKGPFIDYKKSHEKVLDMIKFMSIKCQSKDQEVTALSGGNQQKVILGRWICVKPEILILDQPTRGIDIGAKAEIYQLINDLAENGTSIILISDELDEIVNLSDNIIAIKKGEISKVYDNKCRDITHEELLHSMVV